MDTKMIKILLVEDNSNDIELTTLSFKDIKIKNHLYVVNDGVEAMDFLYQKNKFTHSPRPDLILLDLNLPKKDGRRVLEEIKEDPRLHNIPIIILTSSDSETDIVKSYKLNANAYIKKPVRFEDFAEAIQAIEDFWFAIVKLPPK